MSGSNALRLRAIPRKKNILYGTFKNFVGRSIDFNYHHCLHIDFGHISVIDRSVLKTKWENINESFCECCIMGSMKSMMYRLETINTCNSFNN